MTPALCSSTQARNTLAFLCGALRLGLFSRRQAHAGCTDRKVKVKKAARGGLTLEIAALTPELKKQACTNTLACSKCPPLTIVARPCGHKRLA